MRASALVALMVAVPVVAGCLGGDEPEPETPIIALPYTSFLCPDGSRVRAQDAGEGDGSRCNVAITGNAPGNNGPGNELTIAVDPTNPLRLLAGAKDYTLGPDAACGVTRVWSGVYWSDDGGFTWKNELFAGYDRPFSEQDESATNGYHCNSDPVAYWDDQGNAYYSGLAYSTERATTPPNPANQTVGGGVASNVWIARSGDGGASWTPAYNVAQGGNDFGALHDKQWFTYDPSTGNLYFTWSMFVTDPLPFPFNSAVDEYRFTDQVVFTRSEDGGETWSPLRVLYESGEVLTVDVPTPEFQKQFSMPAVDADGTLYVIWLRAGKSEVWFTKSEDQGETWTTARVILAGFGEVPSPLPPTGFRAHTYPILVVDRSGGPRHGTLYIVYSTYAPETKADTWMIRSTDEGRTWSVPVLVHDDGGTATDQFMPWADVGPSGDLHVVYYDRRHDPENRLLHVYYARSGDGKTFDPSIRLTEFEVNSTLSRHQGGFEFLGDYIGIMEGTNGWVHPIWVDTRDGRADAYTTIITRE